MLRFFWRTWPKRDNLLCLDIMKKVLIKIIKFYQRYISRLKGRPSCRFYPTCSQYAVMAIEKYGALRGSLKAIWRILRCNPLSKGGIDYP